MNFDDRPPSRQNDRLILDTTLTNQACHICGLPAAQEGHECLRNLPASTTGLPDPYIGQVIGGHYEILSRLGEGGMSVVYKARHELSNKIVAIKVLKPMLALDQLKLARFQQEATSVSKLNHPNIIRVWHFAVPAKAEPYLVMDFIDGRPLSEILQEEGQLSLNRTLDIYIQVCDALAHAHESGVVHRDIKPSNILLCQDPDGTEIVKIVDFGIAKLTNADDGPQNVTQTGEVFGSPLYMSPEQCAAKQLDARSDIYSTACVIFETLVGEPPISGASPLDTMHMHVFDAPKSIAKERPELPHAVQMDAILFKALAKHPDQRHQTIKELQHDLRALRGAPDGGLFSGTKAQIESFKRKRNASGANSKTPRVVLAAILASVAVIAASAVILTSKAVDWKDTMVQGQQKFDQGDLGAARSSFQQSLDLAKKVQSPDRIKSSLQELSDVAFTQNDTKAPFESELSKRDQSSTIDTKALLGELAALQPDNKDKAEQLHNTALAYAAEGQIEQAIKIQKESGQLAQTLANKNSYNKTLLELSRLNALDLKYDEATKYLEQAKEQIKITDGPSSKLMASCHALKAQIEAETGDPANAQRELLQAIAIYQSLPLDQRSVGAEMVYQVRLANLLSQYLHNPIDAQPILDDVIKQLETTEPKSDGDWITLAQALAGKAGLFDLSQQYSQAKPLLARAFAIDHRLKEAGLPLIADALVVKAKIAWHAQDPSAEQAFKDAIAAAEGAYGKNSSRVGTYYQEAGKMYLSRKHYPAAETALRRALELAGPSQSERAATVSLLSSSLAGQNKKAEADALRRQIVEKEIK